MKNKFLKKAYVSIEVVIVAAVILTAGLCGLLAFVKNAKERNNGMLNAIDDIYAELDKPISGTGGGAGGIGGGVDIIVRPYSANLIPGLEFNAAVPQTTTDIVFTDIIAPEGATLTDLSVEQNGSIVAWLDGTTYYVSSQDSMTAISFNEDCTGMFGKLYFDASMGRYPTSLSIPYLDSIEFNGAVSTSKVVDMKYMFAQQNNLEELDLSAWDISHAEDMSYMFNDAGSYDNKLIIKGLNTWDISSLKNAWGVFYGANVVELDLSSWDTRNVESMGSILGSVYYLEKITFGENWVWQTSNGQWPYLPSPDSDCILEADGYWYDEEGNRYLSEEMPSGAGTYYAYSHRCEDKNANDYCDGCNKHLNCKDIDVNYYCDECSELLGDAYAIYVQDNGTLYFIRSYEYPEFDSYDGGRVTMVYSDFEDYDYYMYEENGIFTCYVPWVYNYRNNSNLNKVVFVDEVKPISTAGWFALYECSQFDLTKLNTTNVTNMSYMFYGAGSYSNNITINGLQNFQTSNVKDMSLMFKETGYGVTNFSVDLSNWDVSNVTNMSYMFNSTGYYSETCSINLSNWDTSNVQSMEKMFGDMGYCSTILSIDGLSNWDVSNVRNMSYMFYYTGCYSTDWAIGDLSNWDTSNVTLMNGMLSGVGYSVESFSMDLSKWKVSNVTNMENMFDSAGYGASTFSLNLTGWDVSNVTNMSGMFSTGIGNNISTWLIIGLTGWNVLNVTDMSYMFSCTAEKVNDWSLDLTGWDTSNVTNMSHMFYNSGINSKTWTLVGISNLDVSSVTSMDYMFAWAGQNATSWMIDDISNWDISNVTNMNYMFYASFTKASQNLNLSAWKNKINPNVTHQNFGPTKMVTPWD